MWKYGQINLKMLKRSFIISKNYGLARFDFSEQINWANILKNGTIQISHAQIFQRVLFEYLR